MLLAVLGRFAVWCGAKVVVCCAVSGSPSNHQQHHEVEKGKVIKISGNIASCDMRHRRLKNGWTNCRRPIRWTVYSTDDEVRVAVANDITINCF